MINSLRPLLADCPVVLQRKWHWDHLSMLPDNAHKCEICQTQYVNNHNCTGWGHVQANPTEMLWDDVGLAGFNCDSSQRLSSGKEREKFKGWYEISVVHHRHLYVKSFGINVGNKCSECIHWTDERDTAEDLRRVLARKSPNSKWNRASYWHRNQNGDKQKS